MKTCRLTLQPRTAFGTPLAGDTLFGQLCWTLRHRHGNPRLNELLEGYTAGRPFAVVSDPLPFGHLPLPSLPSTFWNGATEKRADQAKILKKKRWLPLAGVGEPLPEWQRLARSDAEVAQAITGVDTRPQTERAQPHNSINRQTGTTGTGAFAPYTQSQQWFAPAMRFQLYVALDESRLTLTELHDALAAIGETGYGRDASIGLGKFALDQDADIEPLAGLHHTQGDAWLTLGPTAPQGLGFCRERSYYQPLTRFGRHGDIAVHSGNPFKRPVLLACGGAVFSPLQDLNRQACIGQGLAGVSDAMPETVHQGYAPVLGIRLPASGVRRP
ncbi:MAG: CRISPR-associated protein Csm7 [Candidatus Accumulibacter propinquus]|jgi:CRISPR-associated protein Csm4|uniref:type III-A CRISPR-associated RAMP protein Csm4 n=1 Tax=Candidatus Accumulibacter propinquus TaxID=2954380 RepID=UPI002FC3273B